MASYPSTDYLSYFQAKSATLLWFSTFEGSVNENSFFFFCSRYHSVLPSFTSGSSCSSFVADVAEICNWLGSKKQSALFIYSLFSFSFFFSRWFPPRGLLFLLPSLPWQPLINVCISIYWTWWFNLALPLHGKINRAQTLTASHRNLRHSAAGGKLRGNQLF